MKNHSCNYLIKTIGYTLITSCLSRKWNRNSIIIRERARQLVISPLLHAIFFPFLGVIRLENYSTSRCCDYLKLRKKKGKGRRRHPVTHVASIVGRWDNSSEKLEDPAMPLYLSISLPFSLSILLSFSHDCYLAVDDSLLRRPRPNISASPFNLE